MSYNEHNSVSQRNFVKWAVLVPRANRIKAKIYTMPGCYCRFGAVQDFNGSNIWEMRRITNSISN